MNPSRSSKLTSMGEAAWYMCEKLIPGYIARHLEARKVNHEVAESPSESSLLTTKGTVASVVSANIA